MKVVFSHGKESGPWGSKISKLAERASSAGFAVDSIDYTDSSDPEQRVLKLQRYLQAETQPYLLVGSSMGGYVSLVAAQSTQPVAVFLLAPALYMPGYQQQQYSSDIEQLQIVHGWSDTVIPVAHSIKFAQQAKCSLHLIDSDHRLNSSLTPVIELFDIFLARHSTSCGA